MSGELLWLLSVDPGTHSAWVLWEHDVMVARAWRPVRVGRLELPATGEPRVLRCQRLLLALGVDWSRTHVVVEGQFYVDHRVSKRRGYQSSPWTDVELLIECRAAWQDAATLLGASTSTALPGAWILAMTRGERGSDSKARIKAACRRRLPRLELVADEHDAALLGLWWLQEQRARLVA